VVVSQALPFLDSRAVGPKQKEFEMLITSHAVYGSSVFGTDKVAGTIRDFLFDDQTWEIQYFVVHSGRWLTGHCELLTPFVVEHTDWIDRRIDVRLTEDQVVHSPPVDAHRPASYQRKVQRQKLIAWDAYWTGILRESPESPEPPEDPHLDSAKEVAGYHIHTPDGGIGHVEDFIIDDEAWMIRYLVADTRNWLPGKHVLIGALSVDSVTWDTRRVSVNLNRAAIQDAPQYDRDSPVDREYEDRLCDHYGLPKYWAGTPAV
jgi:uncharacterized protein YrrD